MYACVKKNREWRTAMDIEKIMNLAKSYLAREHHEWFQSDVLDAVNREDIEGLNDRFYQELTFGTAGMRGIIGGGTNRMNPLSVSMVTQGLAAYASSCSAGSLVVIAYDSRHYSPLFARTAAGVLCANGLKTAMFRELRPVPMLSFAVRYLHAQAGITITASHNPAEYNGYKVYWSDGAQVTPPHDEEIVREVQAVRAAAGKIACMDLEEAEEKGLFQWIDDDVDEAYYSMVKSLSLRPELFSSSGNASISVVYTSLHGAGRNPVHRVLGDLGTSVITVKEQDAPDGSFPTVSSPNPEDPKAMAIALEYAVYHKADIVLGTDPDGDRLGIAVPVDDSKTDYRLLTGNQIAVLLCDYLYSGRTEKNLGTKTVTVKSIVTTDLMRIITEHNGGRCVDVLTGFKYIAEIMKSLEGTDEEFLFGAEESYGFLVEQDVRDKDAVSAACLAVEMTKYHQERGVSLLHRLEEIWKEFGYHEELVLSRTLPGQKGQQQILQLMEYFRNEVTEEIAGDRVTSRMDLLTGETGLSKSNMLIFRLEGGRSFMLRPSGTEPKIKCYMFANSDLKDLVKAKQQASEVIRGYEAFFDEKLALIQK